VIEEFRFGPWLPDAVDHRNPGLEVCTNAIPGPSGYKPMRGPAAAGFDVGAPVLSAAQYSRGDGTRIIVCATAGDLHVVAGTTINDSGLSLALTEPVVFERFGSSVYASNKAGVWYLDDIDTDVAFVAAAWTVPAGRTMARIADFMFMGDLTDTDASDAPFRVRWSPFNNPQGEWETDIATQSDAVDMPPSFGRVMAIGGGTSGLIFQRTGISRIFYTGGASVFSKELIDQERGCAATFSLVKVGESFYFLSDDGFFVTEGTSARPISRGRVWEWFLANSDQAYLGNVQGAVDLNNRCVVWTLMASDGAFNGLIFYNWETEWWGYATLPVDCALASTRAGLSLEDVAALYSNLDTMPISLDSPEFAARGRSFAVFIDGEYQELSAAPLAMSMETGEFQPQPGRRAFVRAVTPLILNEDETTLVTLGGRNRQNTIYTTQADVALGPTGYAPFNFDARYFRVAISVPEGDEWDDAYGFQVDFDVSGET
jgi:hypothetical protein